MQPRQPGSGVKMLSLLWRTIDKIAVYVPGAARESQNLRTEIADKWDEQVF